jgi:hypothetical protein
MADSPTFISGLRASADVADAAERPKNFREAILWLDPQGMTPLTAMSAKMKKETTDDPEFSWFEEIQDAKRAVIATKSGSETTGTTNTWTLSALSPTALNPARQFKAGDLLMVYDVSGGEPTDYDATSTTAPEVVQVLSVTAGDTITVARGFAGNVTTPVTIELTVDQVRLIGSAYAEGAGAADGIAGSPGRYLNYTQIFKSAFNQTNTAIATRYRTGDAFANDRKRAMFRHSESLEMSALFGVAKEINGTAFASGEPTRTSGGLRYFLQTNQSVGVGAISEDFFLDTLSRLFDYNAGGAGDQRIVMLGNGALNAIQKVVRDGSGIRINYEGQVKFYGMNLLQYRIPQGTFFLKTHPLMNTDPVFRNSMFVLNGRGFIVRPLKGRDTKIQTNIQANDADQRKDQWLTETGWEVQFERTQGYYGGIS